VLQFASTQTHLPTAAVADIQDELPTLTCRVNPRAVRSGFIVTNLIFAESLVTTIWPATANTVAEALAAEVMFPNVAGKADAFIYAVVVACPEQNQTLLQL
jgi:hypothetical protein